MILERSESKVLLGKRLLQSMNLLQADASGVLIDNYIARRSRYGGTAWFCFALYRVGISMLGVL